jgi:Fe2+ or Zn2+ uptake regulation protein
MILLRTKDFKMQNDLQSILEARRRREVLTAIYEAGGSLDAATIRDVVTGRSHRVTMEIILFDLDFLRQRGLIDVNQLEGFVQAVLRERGLEVAEGNAEIPGIARKRGA